MEVALAFVVSTAEAQNGNNGGDTCDPYDAKAVQELLEWRKRLGEETKELDPGSVVDGKGSNGARSSTVPKPRSELRKPDEYHITLHPKSK